jgi:hypothetical protein
MKLGLEPANMQSKGRMNPAMAQTMGIRTAKRILSLSDELSVES